MYRIETPPPDGQASQSFIVPMRPEFAQALWGEISGLSKLAWEVIPSPDQEARQGNFQVTSMLLRAAGVESARVRSELDETTPNDGLLVLPPKVVSQSYRELLADLRPQSNADRGLFVNKLIEQLPQVPERYIDPMVVTGFGRLVNKDRVVGVGQARKSKLINQIVPLALATYSIAAKRITVPRTVPGMTIYTPGRKPNSAVV